MNNSYGVYFITGFVIYAAVLVFIGWLASRKKSNGKDYLTGGGKLPFFLIFSTMAATIIGTGSSMGATSNGFKFGWGGSVYGIGAALGIFLLAVMVKKTKTRDKNFLTMAEEAQYYYGGNKHVRAVMGIMLYIIEVVWLGNHINGGATYLAYVTGINLVAAKLCAVVGFGLYVFIGGYLAVVWTDAIQLILLLVGFVVIVVTAIPVAGGWNGICTAIENAGKAGNLSFYGYKTVGIMWIINLTCAIAIPAFGTPTYKMRVYTSKDNKTATRALNTSALIVLAFSFIPALIGMAAFAIAAQDGGETVLSHPDFAFAYMATTILGPTLGLLFLVAGLSATMSSGDSDAIAAVEILFNDVYPVLTGKKVPEEKIKSWSRIGLVLTLLLAFLATLFAKDIISYISKVGGSFIPGVSVAMVVGTLWKRATWQGGLASVFSGTVFGIIYLAVPVIGHAVDATFKGPTILATLIALVAVFIVSLVTPRNTLSEQDRMDIITAGRM